MAMLSLPDYRIHPARFIIGVICAVTITLIDAYAVSVILLLLGRFFIGERWTVIAFFNTFMHLLWVPALLLLPLCLLFRQKRSVGLLLPAVFAFVFTYGGQFLPRVTATPADAPHITVLSYNLLADGGDVSHRIAVIREVNADIVALQEFSHEASAVVPAALADLYPFIALHPHDQGTAGQAILSRFPVLEDAYWRYDWLPVALGHQRVVLDIGGVPVILYNVHPTHPGMTGAGFFNPAYRSREITDILARMAAENGPVLLMGDFNLTDLSEDYARITDRYQDAYRAAGWGMGPTFPAIPFLRLDYLFFNDRFQAQAAKVWHTSGGSDHHGIVVQLALLPAAIQP